MNNLAFDTMVRVDEIVTDVLAMDLLHSSPDFFKKVLEVAKEPITMSLVGIRRSVADTSLGETDIELVADGPDGRCAILIENKVRAPLMDRQFARYRMRGHAGIEAGQWTRFRVILMSPRSYYEALDVEHYQHIDANLSYEDVVTFLGSFLEFSFKRHVFQSAITDYRKGYVKSADTAMMNFYQNYWAVASMEFPQLRMAKPEIVGRDGSWIYFPPLYAGNGVRLIHKFKGIGCELAVATRNGEKLAEELIPFLETDMIARSTKSMAFVNVKTPAIDHIRDFLDLRTDVVLSLQALDRLRSFALDEQVRSRITALL
ncbi:PD-(D/E)XK nuclease family protein [Rhizobium laguerreae]|uniref:PD-(D/E)XK nuclease family protein n=1 Tax=Rhizobium laguerreae TaxID=1076926 RepID=UPI001C8FE718|nr:PD-(D/E)XK nuclease family protein [Rhizobium laguerreae]MBY3386559.1 PD-(D/E)XK nuclease family protein [Rhizobium laguerreae]MBY3400642.1 PD-(D/E)XK nuclease family protein [Rhizobium laguerreae]MBY3407580.1 PD-(D/E)XK nuclease family protein [Rhizobium laguerreae]